MPVGYIRSVEPLAFVAYRDIFVTWGLEGGMFIFTTCTNGIGVVGVGFQACGLYCLVTEAREMLGSFAAFYTTESFTGVLGGFAGSGFHGSFRYLMLWYQREIVG